MYLVYYIYIYFNNIIFYVWIGKPVKTLYLYINLFFCNTHQFARLRNQFDLDLPIPTILEYLQD